jgi:hypothetical protein
MRRHWKARRKALRAALNNGPHGFSELLYAYTSTAATNGNAFPGLNANTPFFNLTLALAMLCGRYSFLFRCSPLLGPCRQKESPCLGRHLADRRDAICLSDRRHSFDSWGSHFLPGARDRPARRALVRVPAALILLAWLEWSRRRFNRVSLSPVYFTGVPSVSNLYAAMDTLSVRSRAQAKGSRRRQHSTANLKGKRYGTDRTSRLSQILRASLATTVEIISLLHRHG